MSVPRRFAPFFAVLARGPAGLTAGQDVAVTLRDIGSAGATTSAAVGAGGDAAQRSKARELSFADARATTEEYATLAGRERGDVVLVREQVAPSGPVPKAAGATRPCRACRPPRSHQGRRT